MDTERHEAYRMFFEARMLKGESPADIRKALEYLCVPFESRCAFCPNPATRYCDFIFGWEKKGTATLHSQIVKPGEGGYTSPSMRYDHAVSLIAHDRKRRPPHEHNEPATTSYVSSAEGNEGRV